MGEAEHCILIIKMCGLIKGQLTKFGQFINNKKIIIHSHMKNLFELPNANESHHFYSTFSSFKNANEPMSTWGTT